MPQFFPGIAVSLSTPERERRRSLYSDELMYGGKFAFKNRLGQPYSWQEIYRFSLFYFVFEGNFQVQAPRGAYIWRGDLTEGFLRYEFGGLIFGEAYFRNFTVSLKRLDQFFLKSLHIIFIMYITMFETYIKINSLQHLEISRQTYLTGL